MNNKAMNKAESNFESYLRHICVYSIALCSVIGCSSHPVGLKKSDVKVVRDEEAKSDCKNLGPIQGSVSSVKGTFEDALEDMKLDATRKGANFVVVEQSSAYGSAVKGTAYFCP